MTSNPPSARGATRRIRRLLVIGLGSDATTWLSRNGAEYGLCQIYRNELWHCELRASVIDRGCPQMYADPTHDPRKKQ